MQLPYLPHKPLAPVKLVTEKAEACRPGREQHCASGPCLIMRDPNRLAHGPRIKRLEPALFSLPKLSQRLFHLPRSLAGQKNCRRCASAERPDKSSHRQAFVVTAGNDNES